MKKRNFSYLIVLLICFTFTLVYPSSIGTASNYKSKNNKIVILNSVQLPASFTGERYCIEGSKIFSSYNYWEDKESFIGLNVYDILSGSVEQIKLPEKLFWFYAFDVFDDKIYIVNYFDNVMNVFNLQGEKINEISLCDDEEKYAPGAHCPFFVDELDRLIIEDIFAFLPEIRILDFEGTELDRFSYECFDNGNGYGYNDKSLFPLNDRIYFINQSGYYVFTNRGFLKERGLMLVDKFSDYAYFTYNAQNIIALGPKYLTIFDEQMNCIAQTDFNDFLREKRNVIDLVPFGSGNNIYLLDKIDNCLYQLGVKVK